MQGSWIGEQLLRMPARSRPRRHLLKGLTEATGFGSRLVGKVETGRGEDRVLEPSMALERHAHGGWSRPLRSWNMVEAETAVQAGSTLLTSSPNRLRSWERAQGNLDEGAHRWRSSSTNLTLTSRGQTLAALTE